MTVVRRHRHFAVFLVIALVGALLLTRGLVERPGFTDAYYHANAANRLASGQGLTDPYLWTYIGAPSELPAPSHLYWMPLTSLLAAVGMAVAGAPGSYAAAQWPLTLLLAATAVIGYALGWRLGGTRRHAWIAGLLTLFSPYYARFWGATDTFTPYAFVGSVCLLALGLAVTPSHRRRWLLVAGAFAGLAHLTRADGVLLLLVGWLVALWPASAPETRPSSVTKHSALRTQDRTVTQSPVLGPQPFALSPNSISLTTRLFDCLLLTAAYLAVMAPWLMRNLQTVGTPLPIGGAQGMWFTSYDDLFNYPPDASPVSLLAGGLGPLLAARWEALKNNLGTFIAVEGMVVLAPLLIIALWRRRADPFLRAVWVYAVGLHLAMTVVFPFPGYRGGLFHSAAALVPWWAALGIVGLDDVVTWAVPHRRWRVRQAQAVFSAALLVFVFALTFVIASPNRIVDTGIPAAYTALADALPADARVMINDPAQLYYYTGLGGVALPNEAPDVIPAIARRYGVRYLVLEGQGATPLPLWPLFESTPDFLTPLPFDIPGLRLYAISV